MNIVFLGDVVGEPGRGALYRAIPLLRAQYAADAIVVNAENAAGGKGITPKLVEEMLEKGADAITLGDHTWDQPDLVPWLDGGSDAAARVVRPFNLQEGTPGKGSLALETPAGRLGILCLSGRTFMRPGATNPFTLGYAEAVRLRAECAALLVDMHAETTSEKVAMGYRLDGTASAVVGTHTHVQTGDERILEHGTAYLTDAGMCGSLNGVIGRDAEAVLQGCITALPCKYPVGGWPAQVCGVCVVTDAAGRATAITRIAQVFEK
ncbi:MAG: YmdB family metallophosphoesterase [Akkermansia sp.]|nr:YmdB family metallophosphoesterase [Akkermansia sp.]